MQGSEVIVIDKDGLRGTAQIPGSGLDEDARLQVQLADGASVTVRGGELEQTDAQTYRLAQSFATLQDRVETDTVTVPVVEEQVKLGKRRHERTVRIDKSVQEREALIAEPLLREEVKIERVAVNREVQGPVSARQEGDTLVIPLLEERLVVEKRLVVREELRISKRQYRQQARERVPLRSEQVSVGGTAIPTEEQEKP